MPSNHIQMRVEALRVLGAPTPLPAGLARRKRFSVHGLRHAV